MRVGSRRGCRCAQGDGAILSVAIGDDAHETRTKSDIDSCDGRFKSLACSLSELCPECLHRFFSCLLSDADKLHLRGALGNFYSIESQSVPSCGRPGAMFCTSKKRCAIPQEGTLCSHPSTNLPPRPITSSPLTCENCS